MGIGARFPSLELLQDAEMACGQNYGKRKELEGGREKIIFRVSISAGGQRERLNEELDKTALMIHSDQEDEWTTHLVKFL